MAQDHRDFFRILENGRKALEAAGIDCAPADIRLMAEKAFGKSWLELNCNPPDNPDTSGFERLVKQRTKRVPLQYLLGQAHFYESCFFVKPGVLIPRPETELLVELAVKHIKATTPDIRMLDLCCGTGAIGISVKLECKTAQVTCSDVSKTALEVCEKNRKDLGADIEVVSSDLFAAFKGKKRFELIVSNPPYISGDEFITLQTEVKDHEPELALVAPEEGLLFYRLILEAAPEVLTPKGTVMFEIGSKQADEIKKLAQKSGIYDNFHVHKDLNGLDRIITLQLR